MKPLHVKLVSTHQSSKSLKRCTKCRKRWRASKKLKVCLHCKSISNRRYYRAVTKPKRDAARAKRGEDRRIAPWVLENQLRRASGRTNQTMRAAK